MIRHVGGGRKGQKLTAAQGGVQGCTGVHGSDLDKNKASRRTDGQPDGTNDVRSIA